MKKLYAIQAVGLATLLGLCWWKNSYSYKQCSAKWCMGKSLIDFGLIVPLANYFPAMLVAWAVLLVTRGVKSDGLRITSSVISGIILGTISGVALEVLCAISVLSVDLVTGEQGVWGIWKVGPPDTFLPKMGKIAHADRP